MTIIFSWRRRLGCSYRRWMESRCVCFQGFVALIRFEWFILCNSIFVYVYTYKMFIWTYMTYICSLSLLIWHLMQNRRGFTTDCAWGIRLGTVFQNRQWPWLPEIDQRVGWVNFGSIFLLTILTCLCNSMLLAIIFFLGGRLLCHAGISAGWRRASPVGATSGFAEWPG